MKKKHFQNYLFVQTVHKTFADSAFDRARVESLSKELTTTKLELEDEKERVVNLATRFKELEVRHAEAVGRVLYERAFSKCSLDERIK